MSNPSQHELGSWTSDAAWSCHALATARVEQAHSLQSMFCSPAPCTKEQGHSIDPQGATLAENLWDSKQDLIKTTDFISDTHLQIWGRNLGNAEEEEEEPMITLHPLTASPTRGATRVVADFIFTGPPHEAHKLVKPSKIKHAIDVDFDLFFNIQRQFNQWCRLKLSHNKKRTCATKRTNQ